PHLPGARPGHRERAREDPGVHRPPPAARAAGPRSAGRRAPDDPRDGGADLRPGAEGAPRDGGDVGRVAPEEAPEGRTCARDGREGRALALGARLVEHGGPRRAPQAPRVPRVARDAPAEPWRPSITRQAP